MCGSLYGGIIPVKDPAPNALMILGLGAGKQNQIGLTLHIIKPGLDERIGVLFLKISFGPGAVPAPEIKVPQKKPLQPSQALFIIPKMLTPKIHELPKNGPPSGNRRIPGSIIGKLLENPGFDQGSAGHQK